MKKSKSSAVSARKSRPDRKALIVDAAIRCFGKSGVSQTRMSEIAESAGVDQPLIHYYFPTLDSLYLDVTGVVLQSLRTASLAAVERSSGDPVKLMTAYVRAPFDWAAKNPSLFSLWQYFYYLASINPTFTQLNQSIRNTGRERISVMIFTGIEKGIFKAPRGFTVAQLAWNIQGLISGNTILAGTEFKPDWHQVRENTVIAVLQMLGAD